MNNKKVLALLLSASMVASFATMASAEEFPLAETAEFTAMISYPPNTESDPNKRTIFKRLEEQTNVHVNWTAIQGDQWGDKITLNMSNLDTLTDLVFTAGFGNSDLIRYADQEIILPLEDYMVPEIMPNLCAVFDKVPQYKAMSTDEDGHIWAFPWIEQLGANETAIQLLDNMPYINVEWLNFLGLEMPTTVDEFETVLLAFKDNADKLQAEFSIDGSIIPMSFIMNDGGQDPMILTNGFGEGLGDPDTWKHLVVNNDKEVVYTATTEGFRKGLEWLHKLNEEGLIDPEAFTQEWSTYVSKGKSGRYGVCFSWDIANVVSITMDDVLAGSKWVPLPPLAADTTNVSPDTASFTSGYDRGRCVMTIKASEDFDDNAELVCRWVDQCYAPIQSPQNNWGTYGEDDDFDIFVMGENENGEPMLQHAPLGDASPVEVREAEAVGGPLAILDEYYGVYVTCPDDAQYRLDWIKDIFAPEVHNKYVIPNVFMSMDDVEEISNLEADLAKATNAAKSDFVMNGFGDDEWDALQDSLDAYGMEDYVAIFQKYVDAYYAD
ncbi:MAG: extracellular solute-binding protein [Clostridiales bacterium]|nr:extracellular solute-binding protein [Candidatus Blautia equi]